MSNLEKNLEFYNKNRIEFIKKYQNQFILISNEQVKGNFDLEIEAYTFGCKNFGLGNFISKHCTEYENQLFQNFNSRIIFK